MKQAEVVWALAHIAPATPQEVAEFLPGDGPEPSNASSTVLKVWRDGLLIRRQRERSDQMGSDPYEYAIRPVEEE